MHTSGNPFSLKKNKDRKKNVFFNFLKSTAACIKSTGFVAYEYILI